MRLTRYFLLAFFIAGMAGAHAAGPASSRPSSVMCAATVKVWIEVDGAAVPAREPVRPEAKKSVLFKLTGSAPYRGDAVLCNYASPRRDVATSYSVRCPDPRRVRGSRHSYRCG